MNKESTCSAFLFYVLSGTSRSRHKHVVGVVQQIAICTWTGPMGRTGGGKRNRDGQKWRGGGIDRGRHVGKWRAKERVFKST